MNEDPFAPESIPLESINAQDRARALDNYGDVSALSASIRATGLIQPIVLSRQSDGSMTLVAGGRRTKALVLAGYTHVFHGVTMDPERPGFVYVSDAPERVLLEAELDENLHRLDFDWKDKMQLVAKIHKTKQLKHGGRWRPRDTASLCGCSLEGVRYLLHIAKKIEAGDKSFLACKSQDEAIKLHWKQQEDKALAEATRRAMSGTALEKIKTINITTTEPQPETEALPSDHITVPISTMFTCGDGLESAHPTRNRVLYSFPSESFDHIVTDIPYGISVDNFDQLSGVETVRETHDVDQNIGLMQPFLQQAFRLVKPGGFCVFFYDLDHHEKLISWAKDCGWRAQRWPVITAKSTPSRNNAAQYNSTKNYECVMYLRKDSKTVLRRAIPSSIRTYDFRADKDIYAHPFAKPSTVWRDIYDDIAFKGQTVLDPYCGECSSSRAAALSGLVPFGVEIDEGHLSRGLAHMTAVYQKIHNGKVKFT